MPLLLSKRFTQNAAYAVWNIQETFVNLPDLCPEPFPKDVHPVRQAEWIIGRVLIKELCEMFDLNYQGVEKLPTGKPILIGHEAHISISHTFPMASAMINLDKPCGIDIERPRQKLIDTQHKYLHASEMVHKDNPTKLCVIWCGKEIIYKIHGRKYLSLKDEIKIEFLDKETLRGSILRPEEPESFRIHYEWVKDYVLGYST